MLSSRGKVFKIEQTDELIKKIKSEARIGAWISKNEDDRYAILIRTFRNENGIAEIHEKVDDIYYIIDGKAEIVLNGVLHNPKEKDRGELIADSIDNGNTYEIEKGDIVEILRGTPHQIICSGGYMQNLTIKVYSGKPYIPRFVTELNNK